MENKYSLPIQFEQIANVLDDRFMKVKIFIAHTGENRNRSIFSKEVLESMIPSLANVPILGYIATNEDDESDFEGHEERLVVEDNQFKLKYVGRAYGVIPAEHNARFETRYGSDGVEREYLVCEGLVWRKFPEVEEIFDRDGGFKSQSMELQHSSVQGYQNEEGLFVFTSAKFEGACILGEHVTPAMISSTIEKFSVADKLQSELSEMLAEFNAHFSTTLKGDDTVPTNEENKTEFTEETPVVETPIEETPAENFEEQPVVEETPVVEEQTETPAENFEEQPVVEETPVEETPAEETPATEFEEETPAVEEQPVVEEPAKFTVKFELSHDDIRTGLYNALYEHESFKEGYSYISKVFDNHAIIEHETYSEDKYDVKFYKINYVKHENAVSLGEFEELFPMFLTQAEKAQVDSSRNNFTALEEEVKGLREFKAGIELAEKESKLAQYSSILSEEEFNSIKENLAKFSMVEIEKEIGFLLLKKNNFSAKPQGEETPARVSATNTVESNPYGSASIYFQKK